MAMSSRLAIPPGVGAREAVRGVGQLDQRQELIDALPEPLPAETEEPALKLDVLAPGRRRIDAGALGDTPMAWRTRPGSRTTSMPPTWAVPEVGRERAVRILTVVGLPAPFGPSRANTGPVSTWTGDGCTSKSRLRRTRAGSPFRPARRGGLPVSIAEYSDEDMATVLAFMERLRESLARWTARVHDLIAERENRSTAASTARSAHRTATGEPRPPRRWNPRRRWPRSRRPDRRR